MLFANHKPIGLEQRLAELPRKGLPLKARVVVHWDGHHIPFIEAESDSDLAVALGVIHVHLRWGQMEFMRRLALGRVSEMIGPFGIKIDHAFRTLGLARAARAISAILPMETADWLASFVAGINHAIESAPNLPPEFRILGIGRERWQVEDILALGRLTAADATWVSLIPMLRERDRAFIAELWQRAAGLERTRATTSPPAGQSRVAGVLARWFGWVGGSNSVAIAPSRSATGGAWMASDPHLPVMLPNPFFIAGYKSASFHAVGLMVPGLPFVALGRNPSIAWGGTNLHAASSDLFDVSDLPQQSFVERHERLRVRWWRDQTVTIRESTYGPIVSDLAILGRPRCRKFALRWMGSLPSDEITAMLRINRARNWNEFRAALKTYAVPGQNLTYADVEGHIGKVTAARLPRRPLVLPPQPILPRSDAVHWQSFANADDLPALFDPAEGFVVSANERPPATQLPVGYLFSSNIRSERLRSLLGGKHKHALRDFVELQQDVTMPSALTLRDDLVHSIRAISGLATGPAQELVSALVSWDGRYAVDSRGALSFEFLVFHLVRALSGRKRQALYATSWNSWDLIRADIAVATSTLAKEVRKAALASARDLAKCNVWGDLHRLRLSHPAGMFPVVGRRYRFGNWPLAGGPETVLRTAHSPTGRRHYVDLAVSARHVSDLSNPDGNYFVLLGGQDGWLGSTTMLDQVSLWQTGRYVPVPITIDGVRRTFRVHMELLP